MNEIQVGQAVTVRFNGHAYPGEVVGLSKKRFLVRFTTGSGRTRERWYRQEGLHCYQKEAK